MAVFHAKTSLDKAFEVSLLLKFLDGIVETISGTLFLFIKPSLVNRVVHDLVGQHSHDFLSEHLLKWAAGFSKGMAIFAALYLLSHGVIKLVLIVAILREKLWAYIGLIVVTAAFVVYQLYHIIAHGLTVSFGALTFFDFIVIYLTAKEYTRQKKNFAKRHTTKATDDTDEIT
jgi:uncharacterized membrane protein